MRATCEQCGAGHHIRDELVAPGRTFRFTCQTCGAPVVIGTTPPAPEPTTSPGFDVGEPAAVAAPDPLATPPRRSPSGLRRRASAPRLSAAGGPGHGRPPAWLLPAVGVAGMLLGVVIGVGGTLLFWPLKSPAPPAPPARAEAPPAPATAAEEEPVEQAAPAAPTAEVAPPPTAATASRAEDQPESAPSDEAVAVAPPARPVRSREATRSTGGGWRRQASRVLKRCDGWHKQTWKLKQAVKASATSPDGDVSADLARLRSHTTGRSKNKLMAIAHEGRKLVDLAGRDGRYDDQRWLIGELTKRCDGTGTYPAAP